MNLWRKTQNGTLLSRALSSWELYLPECEQRPKGSSRWIYRVGGFILAECIPGEHASKRCSVLQGDLGWRKHLGADGARTKGFVAQ